MCRTAYTLEEATASEEPTSLDVSHNANCGKPADKNIIIPKVQYQRTVKTPHFRAKAEVYNDPLFFSWLSYSGTMHKY